MNTSEIVSALDAEISRLTQVRELLDGAAKSAKRRGRPVGSVSRVGESEASSKASGTASSKRTMSAKGKARIAAAQRERWARQNASTHSAAKKSASSKEPQSKANSTGKSKSAATKGAAKSTSARDVSPKKKLGRPPKTSGKSIPAKVNPISTPLAVG